MPPAECSQVGFSMVVTRKNVIDVRSGLAAALPVLIALSAEMAVSSKNAKTDLGPVRRKAFTPLRAPPIGNGEPRLSEVRMYVLGLHQVAPSGPILLLRKYVLRLHSGEPRQGLKPCDLRTYTYKSLKDLAFGNQQARDRAHTLTRVRQRRRRAEPPGGRTTRRRQTAAAAGRPPPGEDALRMYVLGARRPGGAASLGP